MLKWITKLGLLIVVFLTALSFVLPHDTDAAVSSGGGRGASTSSGGGAKSSSPSSTSRTSVSHQQMSNQVRANQAQQASRQASQAKNQSTSVSHRQLQKQTTLPKQSPKTLSIPKGTYNLKRSYSDQWTHTSFYNNLLFYNLMTQNHLSEMKQKALLQQHLKPKETIYTLTVHTKKGDRVITVPKKDYDKVHKGSHIEYQNGQLKVS